MRSQILFLSQCLPFPPDSGVTNRTYHILQQLQRTFDVTLIAFSRRHHQPNEAARIASTVALRKELSAVLEPVPISSEWSLAEKLRVHASSVLMRKPYTFFEYGNPRFARELRAAIEHGRPAMVHMDSMDLYRWLPMVPDVPVACTHHNVESNLLRLRAEHLTNPATSMYVAHQAKQVEKVERELCPRFDINIMTSSVDAERVRALAPGARTDVAPNGVDIDYFRPTSAAEITPGRVVFLGPTYMFPNLDGVEFFLDAVWPIVRQRCPEATLDLIGKSRPGDKSRFESHAGVVCRGYVPDIRPHFSKAACSVVPLRVGGGTRLKILDAWSMGKAIVSTSVGCEGLETADGQNILIRDDAAAFAEAVVGVILDAGRRESIARGGRATAEAIYAWPVIGEKLSDIYQTLISQRPAGSFDMRGSPSRVERSRHD
jgi:glycosyltransferase involved in cell wall biosynthesis